MYIYPEQLGIVDLVLPEASHSIRVHPRSFAAVACPRRHPFRRRWAGDAASATRNP